MLNKIGYNPINHDEDSNGFNRPPQNLECILDYFNTITPVARTWAKEEMEEMLGNPGNFFFGTEQRLKAELLSKSRV